jgi:NADPH-dependent curcumin reductase CurA
MAESENRQWLLRRRPEGLVSDDDFELRVTPRPSLDGNAALIRTLYFSFDPTQRGWLNDAPGYMPPVQIGEPMRAWGLGQVIESTRSDMQRGDLVQGMMSWQDYVVASEVAPYAPEKVGYSAPLTHVLSIYGLTGITAYVGTVVVANIQEGEVVVVSGAAGATGSVVGQIAKLRGATRVIGIAGGAEKCRWLVETAGFDAAIDYRSEKVSQRLRELAPKGVDVFFDNVGGPILDSVLLNLAMHARVIICGGISSGYGVKIPPGPKHYMQLVFKSATMRGFLLMHYADRTKEAMSALMAWVSAGKLQFREDIAEGLELAPATLRRLFEGNNFGKQLLKVADPPLAIPGEEPTRPARTTQTGS